MRKHIPIIALAIMLALPSLASAVYLDAVTGNADCNGWNTDVEITFRSGARTVQLDYVVALLDAGGMEMERFEYSESLEIPSQPTVVYSFAAAWTVTLPEGGYTMTCEVVLWDIFPDGQNRFEDGFTTGFECGAEDPGETGFCPRGSGYWKNHPAEWPVTSLDLGADHLDQAALLDILRSPVRGSAPMILARALIAAKLNMAAGAGTEIAPVIDAADTYLTEHPVGSKPRGWERQSALSFMSDLGQYNNGDCEDEPAGPHASLAPNGGKLDYQGNDKAAGAEVTPLGSLKALFR
jgi:hypothetical protein